MSDITKVRIKETGEELVFGLNPRYSILSCIQDFDGFENLTEADFEILPESEITAAEWLEFIGDKMTDSNYHSERRIMENAVGFMTDEKAIEYLKQVGKVMP